LGILRKVIATGIPKESKVWEETQSLRTVGMKPKLGIPIARIGRYILMIEGGQGLEEIESRIINDRRRQPTPALSWHTLWGRRTSFRRKEEQGQGGYVDRYNAGLLFALVLITVLNLFDFVLTMTILNDGGEELNPLVRHAIEVFGNKFWIWKFLITSFCLVTLCLHSQFRRLKVVHAIASISFIYAIVLLYQVCLIFWR
jgi:hypothetical protein